MKIYYYMKSHCELPDIDGEEIFDEKPDRCFVFNSCKGKIDWNGREGKCEDCGILYNIEGYTRETIEGLQHTVDKLNLLGVKLKTMLKGE